MRNSPHRPCQERTLPCKKVTKTAWRKMIEKKRRNIPRRKAILYSLHRTHCVNSTQNPWCRQLTSAAAVMMTVRPSSEVPLQPHLNHHLLTNNVMNSVPPIGKMLQNEPVTCQKRSKVENTSPPNFLKGNWGLEPFHIHTAFCLKANIPHFQHKWFEVK